jgi:hypothetical protein
MGLSVVRSYPVQAARPITSAGSRCCSRRAASCAACSSEFVAGARVVSVSSAHSLLRSLVTTAGLEPRPGGWGFVVESPAITIGEAGKAATAMRELDGANRWLAAETLRQLASRHGHASVVAVLESGGERHRDTCSDLGHGCPSCRVRVRRSGNRVLGPARRRTAVMVAGPQAEFASGSWPPP